MFGPDKQTWAAAAETAVGNPIIMSVAFSGYT